MISYQGSFYVAADVGKHYFPHRKCDPGLHWNDKKKSCVKVPPQLLKKIADAKKKTYKAHHISRRFNQHGGSHQNVMTSHSSAAKAHHAVAAHAKKSGFHSIAHHHQAIGNSHASHAKRHKPLAKFERQHALRGAPKRK